MHKTIVVAMLLYWLLPNAALAQDPSRQLFDTLNQWRAAHGLAQVAYSPSLTAVAQAHVADLERSRPQGNCSPHSWSTPPRPGASTCPCYDPDQVATRAAAGDYTMAQCMWKKPAEITGGKYTDNGFEIAVQTDAYGEEGMMTPALALQTWLDSHLHHAVLANTGPWSAQSWQAMGVAISPHYAVAWFGQTPDGAAHASVPHVRNQEAQTHATQPVQVTIHDASGRSFHTTTSAGD